MNQLSNVYNLEERTAKFGEGTIIFCKNLSQDVITKPLISQLIRSATSIGANYMEANASSSRKDFANKIFICKKEAQETKHWLRMITIALPQTKENAQVLLSECQELVLIFQKITSTLRNGKIKIENSMEIRN
jgi:four helix bundle protein